ncbi:hypothetical protein CERSUDRAFT_118418 [Gelatoporia subvermispora B]|uniref:Uncharacterized protein n=1 Tax=Ceriporiopsis subvermispora (strain B) TaxID=914234 RepID=M2QLI3_CERS8|nr:hypothetical protein CERSUDRAFT_118418 [Gelatoporia subvermispora B]
MIVEKGDRLDDPVPVGDAPPSYETAVLSFRDEKTQATSQSTSLASPTSVTREHAYPPPTVPSGSKQPKRTSGWFIFDRVQQARTAQQVKVTVVSLIRDVVKQAEVGAFSTILQNCAETCKTYNIDFGALLCEQSIEGHSPIYWAIIKRSSEPTSSTSPGGRNESKLVETLLRLAAPFNDTALSEIRLACLQNSDQILFQRLKPLFTRLSGPEDILLGGTHPPDDIEVEEKRGQEGAFIARFKIAMFQKRMNISQDVKLEFIARGRLWMLRFIVVRGTSDRRTGVHWQRPGTWAVTLSLLEHSSPTALDSRLLIEEPEHPVIPPSPSSPTARAGRTTPKPTISLRLKSSSHLAPQGPPQHGDVIVVPLSDSLMAQSLQYADCSYIDRDGTLRGRLEASLSPPGENCVIC